MGTVQTIQAAYNHQAATGKTPVDCDRFGAVWSRYSPALFRIAFRKLGNVHDAEDALQDGLLSAFRNMHQFRGDSQFSTWLGSIVLNSARMHLRRRRKYSFVSLDEHDEHNEQGAPSGAEQLEDSAPDPEETLRQTQSRENLEQLTERLPVRLRAVFRLRVLEGLTTAEAAAALGIPEGTLKARFFRARHQVLAIARRAIASQKTKRAG